MHGQAPRAPLVVRSFGPPPRIQRICFTCPFYFIFYYCSLGTANVGQVVTHCIHLSYLFCIKTLKKIKNTHSWATTLHQLITLHQLTTLQPIKPHANTPTNQITAHLKTIGRVKSSARQNEDTKLTHYLISHGPLLRDRRYLLSTRH